MKKSEDMPDADLTFEWMAEEIPWIIGSRKTAFARSEVKKDWFGTLLINARDWVTTDKWNRSLELFARYVMPQFTARDNVAGANAWPMWRSAGPDRRSRNDSLFYLLTTGCQPFSSPQVNSRAMMCPAMQTVRNGERHRPQDMEKGHLSHPKDDPDLRKPSRTAGFEPATPLTPSHDFTVAGRR